MKLLHISDLHIGKRLKGYSLLDEQKYILNQIIDTAKEKDIKAIIISGDIYDIATPSNEAINCFDEFISKIHSQNISCYAVSGNHDSIQRISFASDVMARENIFFAKKYKGKIEPAKISENVNIWLLPFIRPLDVREFHADFEIGNYNEMMKAVIQNLDIDTSQINILVAHQFVTNRNITPELSESETVCLGTLENVDFSNFDKFSYVALGHIHKPQSIGRQNVRYCGSPLKYSFSEWKDKKSMVLINVENNELKTELIDFKPLRDMKEITGTFEEILKHPKTDDYVKIILKDENYITDIKNKLENNFPNIMEIVYDNECAQKAQNKEYLKLTESKTPAELFEDFYEIQNNKKLDDEQKTTVEEIFEDIKEMF